MSDPILVVDDHPAVRMAVCCLLEREGLMVCAQTDNGREALEMLRDLQPCTLILDISIPGVNGLTVIDRIVAQRWAVKVVVLTGQASSHMALLCEQRGALGFVSKTSDLCEVVNAVKAVQANYSYFPVRTLGTCADSGIERKRLETLSSRELRVLQQLTQGLGNKEIAERMMLSPKTISTYKRRLLRKLGGSSVLDLFELAKRNGLV